MAETLFSSYTVRRIACSKLVHVEGNPPGSFSRRPDGEDTVTVDLFIDGHRLAEQLAPRARKNKRGRATLAAGAIRVKITEIIHTRQEDVQEHEPRGAVVEGGNT